MDVERFDRLTRILADSASRRTMLKRAFAAAMASIALGGRAEAAQVRRRPGEICRKNGDCVQNAICQKTKTGRSVCTCSASQVCGNRCLTASNMQVDPTNCGSCGNVCPSAPLHVPICTFGICGLECAPGYKDCDGTCIPTSDCCTHADCDDNDGCTVDICGPTSHKCLRIAISLTCESCTSGSTCSSGTCCGGRCCPEDSTCSVNQQGYEVCCPSCDLGSCCDQISLYETCGPDNCGVGFNIGGARCLKGVGICASCPTQCTTEMGSIDEVGAGNGTCGVDNACAAHGMGPVGAWF